MHYDNDHIRRVFAPPRWIGPPPLTQRHFQIVVTELATRKLCTFSYTRDHSYPLHIGIRSLTTRLLRGEGSGRSGGGSRLLPPPRTFGGEFYCLSPRAEGRRDIASIPTHDCLVLRCISDPPSEASVVHSLPLAPPMRQVSWHRLAAAPDCTTSRRFPAGLS